MSPSRLRPRLSQGAEALTPFQLYREYIGLKKHFSDWSYDYERYGSPNVRPETFDKRPDRQRFVTLAQKPLARWRIVSALASRDAWIGDVLSEESGIEARTSWGRIEAITEVLREELEGVDPDNVLRPIDGRHPDLARRVLSGRMSREVGAIMVGLSGCVRLWRRDFPGDPVMEDLSLRLSRYYPLLEIDRKKVAKTVKEVLWSDK